MLKSKVLSLSAMCVMLFSAAFAAQEVQEAWLIPGGSGAASGNAWLDAANAGRGMTFVPASAAGNSYGVDTVHVATGVGNPTTVQVLRASDGQNLGSYQINGTGDGTVALYRIDASEDGVIFGNGFEGSVQAVLDDQASTQAKVIDATGSGGPSRTVRAVGSVADGNCTLFVADGVGNINVFFQTGTLLNGLPTFNGTADATIATGLTDAQGIRGIGAVDAESLIACDGAGGSNITRFVRTGPTTYANDGTLGQYAVFVKNDLVYDGSNLYGMAEGGGAQDGWGVATSSPNANITPAAGLDNDLDGIYDAGATDLNTANLVPAMAFDPVTGLMFGYSAGSGANGGVFAIRAVDDDAQVVINEFSNDDSSTDDFEFVELKNNGVMAADISGWHLYRGDTNQDGRIDIPASTIIGPGEYYVIGNTAVPNVNQVVGANSLQNDGEWIQLTDAVSPTPNQKDFVLYEAWHPPVNPVTNDDGTTLVLEGIGVWSSLQMVEAGSLNQGTDPSFASLTPARFPDGQDTDFNSRDFGNLIASPGEANETYASVTLPYTNDFDDAEDTYYGPDLAGSFFSYAAQDPTVVDIVPPHGAFNTSAIPASPQGGNVGVFWDSSGGGNAGIVNIGEPIADVLFDAYVYLDATTLAAGQYFGQTIINVRGNADHAFHNGVDIFAVGANGNKGIYVSYVNDNGVGIDPGKFIRLVERDLEAGAGTTNVLEKIEVVPGVNDGWQRIMLALKGDRYVLIVGGDVDDPYSGTLYNGSVSLLEAGGIGYGYREATDNLYPMRVDAMRVRATDLDDSFFTFNTDCNFELVFDADAYTSGDLAVTPNVSNSDLIEGQVGVVTAGGFHPAYVNGPGPMTNGLWDADGLTALAQDNLAPAASLQVEYTLADASTTRVVIFAGHSGNGDRAFINVDVEVDQGAGYNLVETLRTGPFGHPFPGTNGSAAVWCDINETLVQKIRFTFYDVSHNTTGFFQANDDNTTTPPANYPNQGTIIKEIDVYGTIPVSSVPDWTFLN